MFAKLSVMDIEKDDDLHKEVASHIDISMDNQPDLLYFKAVYLTEGMNKNGAVFHRKELVNSIDTIYHKGMDLEHEEHEIVGHIYSAAFSKEGVVVAKEDLDIIDGPMDVVIGGIVYRDRFPEFADEIEKGEWFVSMETYYQDYYLTVGSSLKLNRDDENADQIEKYVGNKITVKNDDRVIAEGVVGKHLLGLHFCGGGFVKKPANPTSIIFETANNKDDEPVVVLNATKPQVDTPVITIKTVASKEDGSKEKHKEEFTVNAEVKKYINDMFDMAMCDDKVGKLLAELDDLLDAFQETAAKWTTAYINKLPNSAFIIIEPAYRQGKTDNKNARHLPYKDDKGKVDLPHLRNAAARCGQLKPVTDSISQADLRKRACAKVQKLVKKYLKK